VRVALFTTCLVDHLAPQVAAATVEVLRRAGVAVRYDPQQTCCGQLPLNDGFWPEARALARRHLALLGEADAVVIPSGSCTAMVRHWYPRLFAAGPERERAEAAAGRTYELCEFLVRRLGVTGVEAVFPHRVTYLASCHGYRELGLGDLPLRLLRAVRGLELRPLPHIEECCGFGGAFAVKMADLSASMLEAKLRAVEASGAEVVTGTDLSCLMHVAGGLRRRGSPVRAVHIAEILASPPP